MNIYDHEDAFKDANLCAGRLTNLPEALKMATDKDQARIIIRDCQDMYVNLFHAFIEGVEWGRKHPIEAPRGEKK